MAKYYCTHCLEGFEEKEISEFRKDKNDNGMWTGWLYSCCPKCRNPLVQRRTAQWVQQEEEN